AMIRATAIRISKWVRTRACAKRSAPVSKAMTRARAFPSPRSSMDWSACVCSTRSAPRREPAAQWWRSARNGSVDRVDAHGPPVLRVHGLAVEVHADLLHHVTRRVVPYGVHAHDAIESYRVPRE